jgi:hypothetical protein
MRPSEEFKLINMEGFERTSSLSADAFRFFAFHGRQPRDTGKTEMAKVELRIALGDPLVVHRITEGVCQKVMCVRIENLPGEFPIFLRKPFLIEAKEGKYLFDDIHSIGGYIGDGGIFTIIGYDGINTIVIHCKDAFSEAASIDEINYDPITEKAAVGTAKARKVLPFLTILSLMLEAERSPIAVDAGGKKARKRAKGKVGKPGMMGSWMERRIYIDGRYQGEKREGDPSPIDKEGLTKTDVFIQGFLRHQPYGPKSSLRKWIYIEGFESSRWTKAGDVRVTVGLRNVGKERKADNE